MLIVEGRFVSDSGGRFKLWHTVVATDKGSSFRKIVTSSEVVVTNIGCKSSIWVAY